MTALFERIFAAALQAEVHPCRLSHRAPAQRHAGRPAALRRRRSLAARRLSIADRDRVLLSPGRWRGDQRPHRPARYRARRPRLRDRLQVQRRAAREGQTQERESAAGAALPDGRRTRRAGRRDVLRRRERRHRVRRLERSPRAGQPRPAGELAGEHRAAARSKSSAGFAPAASRSSPADRDNCRFCDSKMSAASRRKPPRRWFKSRRAHERRTVHARSTRRRRRRQAPPGRLRGRRAGLRQDHRAGGVLPPPGGRRRRPAAHSGHHVHRKGRRQHAQETGAGLSGAARSARPPGARLGLHRPRLLRAPAARERGLRRRRPRVPRARRHRNLAHAAGGHAQRHRLRCSPSTWKACAG